MYSRCRMATRGTTLHCGECRTELARREVLMLATIPPSHIHLVIKEGKEEEAYTKLDKVKISEDEKKAQYCSFEVYCRCGKHVGKVARLLSKEFICYKIDNVYIASNGEEIRSKKLSKVRERLEKECHIEVVNLSTNVTLPLSPSRRDCPVVYCDIRGLTHTSQEIDSLTTQKPRDYQREMFLDVMRGNTLVYLPTGSGKTLIAAMVLSCMKKLNPDKLMVFLVDRIPLVYQQSDYIKSQVKDLRVETLVAEMETQQQKDVHRKLADRKVDVLVVIHQIFLNFLASESNPIVEMSNVSVLVFDEAHHCRGNHIYNQIMNHYHVTPNRFKPVVLGLSASPAGEVSTERTKLKLQELLENLECNISMPVKSEDLIAHVNSPDTSYEVAPVLNTDLGSVIENHIRQMITAYINNAQGCQGVALQELPVLSPNFRGALRRLIDSCHGDRRKIKPLIAGEHVMQMLSVVDVSQVLGYKYASECLRECVQRIVHAASPKDGALKKMLIAQTTFTDVRDLANGVVTQSAVSNRYNILVKHIKQFTRRAQDDESSRGIIFVSMRKTAFKLCEQIRTIPGVSKTLNPGAFVGHGQGSYDGMAWRDEQDLLLKHFRSGVTKLLVSTSVLEEGLDVPICNLVVRFEGAATLRALVQTRGRASRRSDSKFVVICDEGEKHEAQDAILKEKNMKEAIRYLMRSRVLKSQAEEFGCKAQSLRLSAPSAKEADENYRHQHYNPCVTVSVTNLESSQYRVIDFLNSNFEVLSMKTNQLSASSSEEAQQKHVTFELQANEDMPNKEFKSKEEFICHVTEVWCAQLTNLDEEPLQVWLQASLPKKRHNASESCHSLSASSLFLGTLVNRCHFRCEWPPEPTFKKVGIFFDHSLRMLMVVFSWARCYKLEVRYDELEDFIVVDSSLRTDTKRVFITLKHPPRLFQVADDGLQDEDVNDNIPQNNDEDYMSDSSGDRSESETDNFSTDEEYPDEVGNFHDQSHQSHNRARYDKMAWERVSDIRSGENAWGECLTYSVALPSKESIQLIQLLATIQNRFQKKAYFCRVKDTYGRIAKVDLPSNLSFDVMYAVQSVIAFHPAIRSQLSCKFGTLLQSKPSNVVSAALEQLEKSLEQNRFCDPEKTLQEFLNQINPSTSGIQKRLIPSHCALIKRAVITPTRLLPYQPEVMVKNRVLRHPDHDTDDFLCVTIRDEDLSKLSAGRGSLDLLLDDINRVLDEGLEIGGLQFLFLGSSNSQLRNHSCWFVGPSSQPDNIRRWMGDFTHIRCVASYMARMGQCFSTSMDTVGIGISQGTSHDVEDDVEIKIADQKYCFSDGIGRISQTLVAEVVKKITKPFVPSAFQIRFAGYKGVLALDPRLSGKQALFRPSMHKFESFHRRLEVLQTSRPQVVYLNHQVIMLLSNLGVPDEVFIGLQNDMLERVAGMLVNERGAIELLATGAKIGISYHSISSVGIPLTTEPFFKSLLVAMYRNHINELLSRARILLPPAEARLMMGVMDELGVLEPGQVFVQYSALSKRTDREDQFNMNERIVLRGPVVVTRNPCLHPGDVRQLVAVDVPALRHLVDCVVFPRKGSRPHPNEMAGGDLDGDLYFVCWNKSLLPRKPNFKPMNYQAAEKREQTEPITAADMTKFVIDYIRCDQLGVIDNAHKALADLEERGVESDICLHLAELHSLAVDAPKTGKWPQIPKTLRIRECPDFMMKSDKPSYPSDNILGELYRRCKKFQDTASEKYSTTMRVDESFFIHGHERFLEDARKMFQEYHDKMQGLMRLYGIESEAETFTGCFLKLRNRLRKEKTEIAEIVGELVFVMRSYFRRQFFSEFDLDGQKLVDKAEVTRDMLLKASAWYRVTYTHAHDHTDDSDPVHQKRLLGLPWFINDVMLAVKNCKTQPSSPQVLEVRTAVGESLVRLFIEEKTWLLKEFEGRVRTKNAITGHLKRAKLNQSVSMIGSSATFLFNEKSDLDLFVFSQDSQSSSLRGNPGLVAEQGGTYIQDQAKALDLLVPYLKEEERQNSGEEPKKLFWKVRLVNKKSYPVLVCKRPTTKLASETNCLSSFVCDFSSNPDGLSVAILLSSYIKSYPRLLLVFRLIHRWCCVTGLSRNKTGAGNMSNILISMLLVQCMRKRLIQNFNEDDVTMKQLRIVQSGVTDRQLYMEWERVVHFLEETFKESSNASRVPREEMNIAELGEILMEFFKLHEASFGREVPDPLSRVLRTRTFAELLDKEHVDLVKEHMHRAYQLLALYGDAQIMLAISGSEDYKVIFLSPLLSSFMAGVEKSKAQEIARKTGARSVMIRRSFPRSRNSAFLEVKGSEPAIRAVEEQLEKFTVQASRDRVSLMSGCFVEDASLILFEGSRNENDHVSLTPYDGPCHQTHDKLARHVALVTTATTNDYPFRRFTEKFFQQLKVLDRDFDPQVHGHLQFAVHFGRVYLFSVPHVLLEESDAVTIAMLRANKRKAAMQHISRNAPSEITYADEAQERSCQRGRKPKKHVVKGDEIKKKRKRGNPSRSSFFTVVHSPDRVEEFVFSSGFQQEANCSERYVVDICTSDDGVEFYVQLDKEFSLIDVKFPNLRWCMTDVKRRWQPRPNDNQEPNALQRRGENDITRMRLAHRRGLDYNYVMNPYCEVNHDVFQGRNVVIGARHDVSLANDDIILDGWESDVRFLLQSCNALQPRDTRDTKYERYQGVLKAGDQRCRQPFSVHEDLWKDVRLIRSIKSTKYTHSSRRRGLLSNLTVYLNEVSEYSRPAKSVNEFRSQTTRWEVSLEVPLPEDLTDKEAVKMFLHEVWNFALSLSSFVSSS